MNPTLQVYHCLQNNILMTTEELKNKFAADGRMHYFDKVQSLLGHTIRLYQKQAQEKDIAIGQTKIGSNSFFHRQILHHHRLQILVPYAGVCISVIGKIGGNAKSQQPKECV